MNTITTQDAADRKLAKRANDKFINALWEQHPDLMRERTGKPHGGAQWK